MWKFINSTLNFCFFLLFNQRILNFNKTLSHTLKILFVGISYHSDHWMIMESWSFTFITKIIIFTFHALESFSYDHLVTRIASNSFMFSQYTNTWTNVLRLLLFFLFFTDLFKLINLNLNLLKTLLKTSSSFS